MEHRLILGGDEYLPFARSCITKLKKLGLPYADQSYEVNGASIKVRIEPGHEYIRIESGTGYMESGVLDFRNILPGNRYTYYPATIKFTPFVAAQDQTTLPNAGLREVVDGDDSWTAAGCKKKLTEIDVPLGVESSAHFEATTAVFCEPIEILSKKRLMEIVPASTYTGKMKLFVQALYGSMRKSYRQSGTGLELGTGVFTDPPPESTRGREEIHLPLGNGIHSTGIYTHTDADSKKTYFLVQLSTVDIKCHRMRSKYPRVKAGKDAPDALAEAYTLATLVPDVGYSVASGPDMDELLDGRAPLAHGWHFNHDGSKASMVVKRSIEVSGVRQQWQQPNVIGGFEFTLYTISFSMDDDGNLSYAAESVASGRHIPYLQSKIFYPAPWNGMMDLLVPGYIDGAGGWDCYADLSCPVYCYYVNDELTVVGANNTKSYINPGITDESDISILFGEYVTGGEVTRRETSTEHCYDAAGVTVGASSFKSASSRFDFDTVVDRIVFKLEFGGTDNFGNSFGVIGASSYRTVDIKSNVGSEGTPVLVIPYGDASAVLAGLESRTTGNQSSYGSFGFGNHIPTYIQYNENEAPIQQKWSSHWLTWGQEVNPPDAIPPTPNAWSSEMKLFCSAGVVALDSGSGGDDDPKPYLGLFWATGVAFPHYPAPVSVKTSFSGALQHSYCLHDFPSDRPDVSLFGWPDARWSAAVGWA